MRNRVSDCFLVAEERVAVRTWASFVRWKSAGSYRHGGWYVDWLASRRTVCERQKWFRRSDELNASLDVGLALAFRLGPHLPVVSYTTGHEFQSWSVKAIQHTHIEDMWIPFFCNTTNITWSRMEVHTSGYAWRYIRGSMTLAGLLAAFGR